MNINRRSFILRVLAISGGITAILVAIPVIGVILEPLARKKPETWRPVGNIDQFKTGETVLVNFPNSESLPWTGTISKTGSWLRRVSEDQFIAFSVNCTHLGCPVNWLPDAEIFLCPCHGGVYNKDGSYAAGPPPKGLYHYPVRIENNNVEILASPIPITTL
jgi:quinol---cytochrome c reductase iron-sulfur subunit, bacillus type